MTLPALAWPICTTARCATWARARANWPTCRRTCPRASGWCGPATTRCPPRRPNARSTAWRAFRATSAHWPPSATPSRWANPRWAMPSTWCRTFAHWWSAPATPASNPKTARPSPTNCKVCASNCCKWPTARTPTALRCSARWAARSRPWPGRWAAPPTTALPASPARAPAPGRALPQRWTATRPSCSTPRATGSTPHPPAPPRQAGNCPPAPSHPPPRAWSPATTTASPSAPQARAPRPAPAAPATPSPTAAPPPSAPPPAPSSASYTTTTSRTGAVSAPVRLPDLRADEPLTVTVTGIPGLSLDIQGLPADGDSITLRPGTSLFGTLDSAIDGIRRAPNQNAAIQSVGQALANIDLGLERVHDMRGYAGELLNRADRISGDQTRRSIQLESDRSRAEDLDMIQGISDFQNQQVGYQAALKSYAQVQRLSLFQYIG